MGGSGSEVMAQKVQGSMKKYKKESDLAEQKIQPRRYKIYAGFVRK